MSKIKFTGNASGSATFDIQSPASSTDRTISIPDKTGTFLVGSGIIQVLQTTKTDTFEVAGTSFVDVTGMSVTITPASTSNKILVLLNVHYGNGHDAGASIKLLRGSSEIFLGDASSGRERVTIGGLDLTATDNTIYSMDSASACYLDSPSTTSATTYKMQVYSPYAISYVVGINSTVALDNYGYVTNGTSSITVMEVAA